MTYQGNAPLHLPRPRQRPNLPGIPTVLAILVGALVIVSLVIAFSVTRAGA